MELGVELELGKSDISDMQKDSENEVNDLFLVF